MKLIIQSDGTSIGTFLCDAATGEKIQNVSKITWTICAKENASYATITLVATPIHAIGNVVQTDEAGT